MVDKGFHCAYDIHYHVVFPVKYRKALLQDQYVQKLKEITKELEERYEFTMEQIGCDLDHVHLLCCLHPKYSPGQFVRLYKSNTARELFKAYPELKRQLWGGEFWTDGYYVATVGKGGTWEVVEEYVRRQGKQSNIKQLKLL